MAKNRKATEEYILSAVKDMDVTGRSYDLLKEQFGKMDDKRFDIWMQEIKAGKNFVPIYLENHMKGKRIDIDHALKTCKKYGIKIFQRFWYRDNATGIKALSNKPHPFIHLMIRRQIETILNKMGFAENNNRFDTATGAPIDGGSGITQPESLVYIEKRLGDPLLEKMKFRGGDIQGGRDFDQALISSGTVSINKLMENNTSTRVVQTADIYLAGALYETNLDPHK